MIARVEALKLSFTALQAELVRALSKIDARKTRADEPLAKSRRQRAAPADPQSGGPEI